MQCFGSCLSYSHTTHSIQEKWFINYMSHSHNPNISLECLIPLQTFPPPPLENVIKNTQPEGSSAFSLVHRCDWERGFQCLVPRTLLWLRTPNNPKVPVISPSHAPITRIQRPRAFHHPSSSTVRLPPLVTFHRPSLSFYHPLPTLLIYHPPPITPHTPHTFCLANKPPHDSTPPFHL